MPVLTVSSLLRALAGFAGTLSAMLGFALSAQEIAARRQPPPAPPDAFVVDVWTTEHGLPQNSINDIAQTPDGYLWLGTSAGLVRFDGVRFEPVRRTDDAHGNIDRVRLLRVAPGGELWIGTEAGLLRLVPGVGPGEDATPSAQRFARVDLDGGPVQSISALTVGPDGTAWASTGTGIYAIRGTRAVRVHQRAAVHLQLDGQARLWVTLAGAHGALPHRAVFGEPLVVDGEPGPQHMYFGSDAADNAWFGNPNVGSSARVRAGVVTRFAGPTGLGRLMAVAHDAQGTTWLATYADGLLALGADDVPQLVHLPRAGTVLKVLVDAQGVVWAGTAAGGLLRVRRRTFRVYSAAQGFTPRVAGAVFQRRDGAMLFGSLCGGVYEKPRDHAVPRPLRWRGMQMSCATALAESPDGRLWVGGWGTLVRVHGDSAEPVRTADGAQVQNAVALHTMPDGSIWAGTSNAGVIVFDADGSQRRLRAGAELRHDDVRFITHDADGRIWIGTVGGVSVYDRGTWTTYGTPEGLGADYVRAVHRAADGSHWLGTYGGGLARLRDGHVRVVRQRDGLSEDVVSAIVADDAGYLWMSGNKGIFRARLAELDSFADGHLRRVASIPYGSGDGLLEPETNGGFHPAAWRSTDGFLWFPTLEGVAVVDPRAVAHDAVPSPRIEEVQVNGSLRAWQGALTLEAGRPSVELRYTALGVASPEHLSFRYRLVPFDAEWTDAGARRVAYFPRLPPGTYRFEVAAAGRDGGWSEPATLAVRVNAALWERRDVRFGLAAALIAALVAGVVARGRARIAALERARAQQQALSRALLDEQERERRRIANELHDGLGQDLLLAGNYAAMALASEHEAPARAYVEQARQLNADALRSIRELARSLAPRQLEHAGLHAALQSVIRTAAESSGIDITLEADEIDTLLDGDARIAVFRIVQEAVSNIVKHSEAATAQIALRREDGTLTIAIEDDGRGFDLHAARGFSGIGLGGIRERVGMLGGDIQLSTAPAQGTRYVIRIPL